MNMKREIKFRAWSKSAKTMHPIWMKLDDENGKYILMQYTGLKDKNGKEIYEGDFIEFDNHDNKPLFRDRGIIEYEPKYAAFQIISGDLTNKKSLIVLWAFENVMESNVVVIGNFYENPELLK